MSIFDSPRFLRNVLRADAVSCLASGAVQLSFTQPLAQLLRLGSALLTASGAFLLIYALVVGLVASREPVSRSLVALFAVGNFGWAAGCIALLAGPWLAPSLLGQAWVAAQALTVVVLGYLQWLGLKRTPSSRWA